MTVKAAELQTAQSQQRIEAATDQAPSQAAQDVVRGASALGLGLIIERGFGFLANLLAARIGGASTFGAYSLALSTANNISSYAAGGIGSTAIRFSGRYARESAGYATLSRALAIISLVSAALATAILWAGAGPIARLLGKQSLIGLLHWAALSAAGMILLECCRGFLVGQRRLPAILLLSLTVGLGLITLLPVTAKLGAVPMIASQGTVTLGAVALCMLSYRALGLAATHTTQASSESLGRMLREVWSFGLVQLAGLVGMNTAGWWLTTLVAHSDTSLVQMGYFAISHQLRNIAALAPGLLTESSLAVMAQGESTVEKTPDQVMAVCTLATTFVSLLVAGVGMVLLPWGLKMLYGKTYVAASAATAAALATAVVHSGSSPASARLSIVSIKMTGAINTIWAVMVAAGATLFFFIGGDASKGALIYLAAHLVSAVLVLSFLTKRQCVPHGMNHIFVTGATASIALAMLAFWRHQRPDLMLRLTSLMVFISCAALCMLVALGRQRGWIPSFSYFAKAFESYRRLRCLTR